MGQVNCTRQNKTKIGPVINKLLINKTKQNKNGTEELSPVIYYDCRLNLSVILFNSIKIQLISLNILRYFYTSIERGEISLHDNY